MIASMPAANEGVQGPSLYDRLREFYGRTLTSRAGFTEKCCSTDETARRYRDVLSLLPAEVMDRHYGCGCPIPEDDLAGLTVLDLGSGAGVDAFLLAFLVGQGGFVHGIDMTPEQLDVARRNTPEVMRRFGFRRPNVAFHEGFIETAEAIPDASVDLVISDCVINLSPFKDAVFRTIARVLRDGGEFLVADVAADRRVPLSIAEDPKLIAECVGGAMYEHDWLDLMRDAGFRDPRVMRRAVLQREVKGEPIVFSSLTVRGFRFREPLDRRCEDYGQTATYIGTVPASPARFALDARHVFEARRPTPVCRNTARMLSETRLGRHFVVTEPVGHFGLFACPSAPTAPQGAPSACC